MFPCHEGGGVFFTEVGGVLFKGDWCVFSVGDEAVLLTGLLEAGACTGLRELELEAAAVSDGAADFAAAVALEGCVSPASCRRAGTRWVGTGWVAGTG